MAESICLDCRTLLPSGEPCDLAKHRAVELAGEGLQRLEDEVWGPPSRRHKIVRAAQAGGTGGLVGGGLEACGGCTGLPDSGVALAIMLAALAGIGIYFLAAWLIKRSRARRGLPVPRGARWLASGRGLIGRVRGQASLAAPSGSEACVAYGVELTARRNTRGPVMLRAGETAGFDLILDDGETLRVPAGHVRVVSRKWPSLGERAAFPLLAARSAALAKPPNLEYPLVPFDDLALALIQPGDRIEVIAPTDSEPIPGEGDAGYRDSAPSRQVTTGVPTLRIIR